MCVLLKNFKFCSLKKKHFLKYQYFYLEFSQKIIPEYSILRNTLEAHIETQLKLTNLEIFIKKIIYKPSWELSMDFPENSTIVSQISARNFKRKFITCLSWVSIRIIQRKYVKNLPKIRSKFLLDFLYRLVWKHHNKCWHFLRQVSDYYYIELRWSLLEILAARKLVSVLEKIFIEIPYLQRLVKRKLCKTHQGSHPEISR